MKLYLVTKRMSAKLASETKSNLDFKPLTFGPFLKKTLYIYNFAENTKYCQAPGPLRCLSEKIWRDTIIKVATHPPTNKLLKAEFQEISYIYHSNMTCPDRTIS